jgi:hypothetical protein
MHRSACWAGNAHKVIVGLFGFVAVPSEALHSKARIGQRKMNGALSRLARREVAFIETGQ